MKKAIIITALPFRKQGNQSMIRFTNMFLKNGVKLLLFTSGKDSRGENENENSDFTLQKIGWLPGEKVYNQIKKIFSVLKSKQRLGKNSVTGNYFSLVRSEDKMPPFGLHNKVNMINKWVHFALVRLDNYFLITYFLLFKRKALANTNLVVGYEVTYTLAGKTLAKIFNKPYINKFQGVILKASERDIKVCKKYYPLFYYGINAADLCIMVNDGTDGEFYAKQRGCENILFAPHGINVSDYVFSEEEIAATLKKFNIPEGKFIVFNNASGSNWKRADRCIRFLNYLSPEIRSRIAVITTYHADDVADLREFVIAAGLDNCVFFIENANHKESNILIRCSDVLLMTNDVSNLGNPVLEAIYYKTPVISINDASLDGFITVGEGGILLDLDRDFDQNLADTIQRMCTDKSFYTELKKQITENNKAKSIEEQQSIEYSRIQEVANFRRNF